MDDGYEIQLDDQVNIQLSIPGEPVEVIANSDGQDLAEPSNPTTMEDTELQSDTPEVETVSGNMPHHTTAVLGLSTESAGSE